MQEAEAAAVAAAATARREEKERLEREALLKRYDLAQTSKELGVE